MKQTKSRVKGMDAKELAAMLKSLAHPSRVEIIQLLFTSGYAKMSVKSIYEKVGLEQSIASRHLSILKNGGLLKKETEGVNSYYCLCWENPSVKCIAKCFSDK